MGAGHFTPNRFEPRASIQITLQRDPHGGPPVPMIEIEPQFVKSVLGMFNVYVALSAIPRLTST